MLACMVEVHDCVKMNKNLETARSNSKATRGNINFSLQEKEVLSHRKQR